MAENYVIEGYKAIGREIGNFCRQNRAHICTGLSVAGTIATGVLSARSGARAGRKIDKREAELKRALTTGEKIRLCGKDFIAPCVAGALAVGGAVGSDMINTKMISERTALLIASEKAYERLERKTREVLGEKKARQVQDEVTKEKLVEEGGKDANGAPVLLTRNAFENAPKSGTGTLYPYVDTYSMLPFWSNNDYIALHVKSLNEMMRELGPRGDEYDYYDKIIGVYYSEWLKGLNFDKKVWNTKERKEKGWNKGFAADGSEDDPIGYSLVPMEFEPGFAVMGIHWEKEPTELRLGRMIKSSGVGL